ncbi:MAG: FAD-binding oxidoreductase [Proteobacteria bacterium]|nr:FAD-binding oxidoreductase [Pseudomonadota bacterium]
MSTNVERGAHAERCARAAATLRAAGGAGAPLALGKATSNLFRDRAAQRRRRLDLTELHHVIAIGDGWVDVEGSMTYEDLVAALLPRGVMPAVVPQLKTITVGGAAAGVGIEATSFAQGLVHHTLLEIDVLLASGDVVTCTPDHEHQDLFHGFPNSYGTLGYALRLRLRTLPVRPYVRVEHRRLPTRAAFFAELEARCRARADDFIDGVVFGAETMVLNAARFVDEAPWHSDYSYEHRYYRSLLERDVDHLSTSDYLWRWDTDWFWCSKNFGADRMWVRRLLGRERLNSRTYTRLMRWNSRWGLTRGWSRLRGLHPESVIQDVDIPIAHAAAFLEFLLREIRIAPIWICPLAAPGDDDRCTLYPLAPRALYVNFGFWDVVQSRQAHETGHYNRLVEREVARLGGIKSLYSDSYYSEDEFDAAYHMRDYALLKAKYDPGRRLLGLYEKCVLRR